MDLALPALERCVQDYAHPWFALQAANVLYRLGESARPALATLNAVQDNTDSAAKQPSGISYLRRIVPHIVAMLDGQQQPLVYPAH
jgi:hypothetical protein